MIIHSAVACHICVSPHKASTLSTNNDALNDFQQLVAFSRMQHSVSQSRLHKTDERCVLLGYFYPALASAKTAVQQDPAGFTQWMTYWVVMSFFAMVELFFDFFVSWVPFYYEVKIVLIIWLTLPRYQGASQIYQRVIHPYLVQYEGKIDDGLEGMRVEATRRIQSLGASAATEIARAVSRQSSSAKEQLLARVLGVAASGVADGTTDSSVPAKSAPSSSLLRETSGIEERDKGSLLGGDEGESGTGGDALERSRALTAESNQAMLEDFMEIMRGGVFVEAEMPSGAEDKQDGGQIEGQGSPRARRIRVLDGKEFCIEDFDEQRAGQGGLEKPGKSEEGVGQANGAGGDRFLVLGAIADPTSAESLLLETSLGEVRLRLPGEDDRDTLLMGFDLLLLESNADSPSDTSRTLHSEADTKRPVETVGGQEEEQEEQEEEQEEQGQEEQDEGEQEEQEEEEHAGRDESVPRSDHGVEQGQEKNEVRLDGGDENEDTEREEGSESEEEEPPELLPPLRQSLVEVES